MFYPEQFPLPSAGSTCIDCSIFFFFFFFNFFLFCIFPPDIYHKTKTSLTVSSAAQEQRIQVNAEHSV